MKFEEKERPKEAAPVDPSQPRTAPVTTGKLLPTSKMLRATFEVVIKKGKDENAGRDFIIKTLLNYNTSSKAAIPGPGRGCVIKNKWGSPPDQLIYAPAPPTVKFALG